MGLADRNVHGRIRASIRVRDGDTAEAPSSNDIRSILLFGWELQDAKAPKRSNREITNEP